ncbi:TIGR02391 family protein [Streptomyces sp. NPDC006476]|uniref:TIGR02391 family protein n=1 Tax=Streptomyces sp. NPDC006476 TaxID=3157175 RepID=UPI0033A6A962
MKTLAIGCFTAIRNPAGHPDGPDWPEQRALEYLAALSALARWIDKASIAIS